MKSKNISQTIGMTAILLFGSMSTSQADSKGGNDTEKSYYNNRSHISLVSKNALKDHKDYKDYKEMKEAIGKKYERDDNFYRSSVIFEGKHFTRTEALAVEPKITSVPESSTFLIFGAGLIGLYALRRKDTTQS